MNYIVFDLEFNQAYRCATNPIVKQEIIEIGAVKVDKNFNIIDKFSYYINPTIYKKMNPFVQEKTLIEMSTLKESGLPFIEVINNFIEWVGKEDILCTWGLDDIRELKNNCLYYNINIAWITNFTDIQRLYSITNPSDKKQVRLKQAIEELDIPQESAFHTAIEDALYTMEIFKKIHNPSLIIIRDHESLILEEGSSKKNKKVVQE